MDALLARMVSHEHGRPEHADCPSRDGAEVDGTGGVWGPPDPTPCGPMRCYATLTSNRWTSRRPYRLAVQCSILVRLIRSSQAE